MPSCRTYRRPAAALILGLCLSLISGYAQAESKRPNIVLIVTDDEDVAAHAFMPKTKALIEDQGAARPSRISSSACPGAVRRGPRSCAGSTRTTRTS